MPVACMIVRIRITREEGWPEYYQRVAELFVTMADAISSGVAQWRFWGAPMTDGDWLYLNSRLCK